MSDGDPIHGGLTMKQLKSVIANPMYHPSDPKIGEIKLQLAEIIEQLKTITKLLTQIVDNQNYV